MRGAGMNLVLAISLALAFAGGWLARASLRP